MVSTVTLICIVITFLITFVLPIVVYIILGVKNKKKGVWLAWLAGGLGFFIAQPLLRTFILNTCFDKDKVLSFADNHYIIYCLLLAASAALVEVLARFVVAKILSVKGLTGIRALAAGLGHGSIESIIIVGTAYINNIIYSVMINTGTFDTMLDQISKAGVSTDALIPVKDALINTAPYTFLLAGYERILTVILHIALSMVVCYFVANHKSLTGVIIAFVCHMVIDFVSPVINGLSTKYLGNVISTSTFLIIVYVWLTVVAVASLVVIKKLYNGFSHR